MYLLPVCLQLNRTVAAVPMSTREGCCCCTYDLHHSPSWLLLLLFIVDQLVYHAVLLLCHIYHPAHAFYNKMKNISCEYDRFNGETQL